MDDHAEPVLVADERTEVSEPDTAAPPTFVVAPPGRIASLPPFRWVHELMERREAPYAPTKVPDDKGRRVTSLGRQIGRTVVGAGVPLLVEDMMTGGRRETWRSERLDELVDAFYAFSMLLMFTTNIDPAQIVGTESAVSAKDLASGFHRMFMEPSPLQSSFVMTIAQFMTAGFSWYLTRSLLRHIERTDRRLTIWVFAQLGAVALLTVGVQFVVAVNVRTMGNGISLGSTTLQPLLLLLVPTWILAAFQYRAWRHAWRAPDLLAPEARTHGFRQAVRLLRWNSWLSLYGLLSFLAYAYPQEVFFVSPLIMVPIFVAVMGGLLLFYFQPIVMWMLARRLVRRGTIPADPAADS